VRRAPSWTRPPGCDRHLFPGLDYPNGNRRPEVETRHGVLAKDEASVSTVAESKAGRMLGKMTFHIVLNQLPPRDRDASVSVLEVDGGETGIEGSIDEGHRQDHVHEAEKVGRGLRPQRIDARHSMMSTIGGSQWATQSPRPSRAESAACASARRSTWAPSAAWTRPWWRWPT